MKREIGGKNLAELACTHAIPDRLHCRGMAVTEIDAEQTVRASRSGEYGFDLRCIAAERLLTENRCASVNCRDALLGVERARRGNHHAIKVEREHCFKRVHFEREGRQDLGTCNHFRVRVADGNRDGIARCKNRFHPAATNPAGPEKAKTDHAGTIMALTKLPDRSRAASSASPSRSSG